MEAGTPAESQLQWFRPGMLVAWFIVLVRRWREMDKYEICFGARIGRTLIGYGK